MKIPITEARRKLPGLLKMVQNDPTTTIEITVRDEIVAELRAPKPVSEKPSEAAKTLLSLRKKLARQGLTAQQSDLSSHVKESLYGPEGVV